MKKIKGMDYTLNDEEFLLPRRYINQATSKQEIQRIANRREEVRNFLTIMFYVFVLAVFVVSMLSMGIALDYLVHRI